MKLKQLAELVKDNLIVIPIIIFTITILMYVVLFFDTKTSIYSDLAEIRYTCDRVDGLGESHATVLYLYDFDTFWQLKECFTWLDVPLVSKHFKIRGDWMRWEQFVNILYINLALNAISFFAIVFYLCYRFYQHQLTFASLQRMVGKLKGEKSNGK